MKNIPSKDEERKALAKIVKIVEDLGPDSYLATSFSGFREIAEQNIDDDSACTWPDRVRLAREEIQKLNERYQSAGNLANHNANELERVEKMLAEADEKAARLAREIDEKNAEISEAWNAATVQVKKATRFEIDLGKAKDRIAELEKELADEIDFKESLRRDLKDARDADAEAWEAKEQIKRLEAQVLELKARLYDYMAK